MGQSGAGGIDGADRRETYQIPEYEHHSDKLVRSRRGVSSDDFPHGQRYSYVNINSDSSKEPNFLGAVYLRNIVTTAEVDRTVEVVEPERIEQRGGLYFEHGYDAHTPKDIVAAEGYENVDLDAVAHTLVMQPDFELRMTGHADTSGDVARNQTLSENRLNTAETMLMAALQRQGLDEAEAKQLYETRVQPHSTIIAMGETGGPVDTSDEVKHQGNRVVSFDLFSNGTPDQRVINAVHKANDVDNHEHVVVVNMGTRNLQRSIDFYPERHERSLRTNQFSIADEGTNFVFKIAEERRLDADHQYTVNYKAENNLIADNTSFLIENDTPGAVTSDYNHETGQIDIRVNGDVAVNIKLPSNIDPAVIRVGQVSSGGQVTISPLTNLDEVAPISEAKTFPGERNALTQAADDIVKLSIETKHIYMEHADDPQAYQEALTAYGFEARLDDALSELREAGINTAPYKILLMSQYSNENSALYNPDQVVFPFQTFQALYEAEISVGHIVSEGKANAYDSLLEQLHTLPTEEGQETGMLYPQDPSVGGLKY